MASGSDAPVALNVEQERARDELRDIFEYIVNERGVCEPGCLTIGQIIGLLREEGILFWRDLRFKESQNVALKLAGLTRNEASASRISVEHQEAAENVVIDYDDFVEFISPQAGMFLVAFCEEFVIPDWKTFVTDMSYHFEKVHPNREGKNAQYIPSLRDADPEKWGMSICSIDGQRFSIGHYDTKFTIQSVSKPVTYGICLAEEGEEEVDRWIGVEPAGRPFNTQDLDVDTQCPFNASVNSGAIMAAGLFASKFPKAKWMDIVDRIRQAWFDLAGDDLEVGFSKETFESEKDTAYNNFAISYNLKGRRGLPRDVDLHKMLDVYLGCCSIEMTAEALAVAAATLANGGVCPISHKEVFPADVVRHVLSETMTCGMYDQAGRFAVDVGLPAKSGVSGALMVIVPNVFGIATFSPRLNKQGNSVRGLEFCKGVVGSYRVHIFEPLRSGNCRGKVDPRINGHKNERITISQFAWAYHVGDAWAVRLRDIFLHSLVQIAFATAEGLSERMKQAIRDEYELIYQVPPEEDSLQECIDAVEPDPSDMSILDGLKQDRFIPDSFRNVIMFAMMEIMMLDGELSENEMKVGTDIANFLGIEEDVALMELDRYTRQVGPRFKEVESFDGNQLKNSFSTSSLRSSTMNVDILEQIDDSESIDEESPSKASTTGGGTRAREVLELRREVFELRRKVDVMSQMLNQSRQQRTQRCRRLSITPKKSDTSQSSP